MVGASGGNDLSKDSNLVMEGGRGGIVTGFKRNDKIIIFFLFLIDIYLR